jgi:hypothetical protein
MNCALANSRCVGDSRRIDPYTHISIRRRASDNTRASNLRNALNVETRSSVGASMTKSMEEVRLMTHTGTSSKLH